MLYRLSIILLCCSLTASAAAAAAQALTPAQAQPAASTVAAVEFTGRINVPEELVRGAVSLKAGDPFGAERLEMDRKGLLALGYFRSVAATQRTEDGRTRVTFRLAEWPRVTHIRVLGNTVVELAALLRVIRTEVGQVLNAPRLQADVRAIEQVYQARGYVAHVSEKLLDEALRSGILRFEVLEVAIEDVQVEGASPRLREKAKSVLAEVPPSLYRPSEVTEDQERLLKIAGIRAAVPRVEPISPSRVRVRWLLNGPSRPDKVEPPFGG